METAGVHRLTGPNSMVTANAVKVQLAGTLQMHVGVADWTDADHFLARRSRPQTAQCLQMLFSYAFRMLFAAISKDVERQPRCRRACHHRPLAASSKRTCRHSVYARTASRCTWHSMTVSVLRIRRLIISLIVYKSCSSSSLLFLSLYSR